MTVKELIDKLTEFDESKKVIANINIGDETFGQDCMGVMEFKDRVTIFVDSINEWRQI